MLPEEITKQIHAYTLAHLTQHPPHSLVHKVVGMVEMNLGIAEAPGGVAVLRGLPRADHTHALFPEVGAVGEGVEKRDFVV